MNKTFSINDIRNGKTIRPVLSMKNGVLFSGDCSDILPSIRNASIDCIFADPPFNLGKDYGNGSEKDALKREDYLRWSFSWLDESIRILKLGGSMFVYILPQWGYHFAVHLEENGMVFRHWIALGMKGTFPRGQRLYPAHYGLLYFTKGKLKTFNHIYLPIPKCRHCGGDIKDYGGHRKYLNPKGLNLTDFWEDTSPARHQKFKARWHINELKPMIPSRCIQISTKEGDIVLDPFGGGGSTYEAAQELKRLWVGIELATSRAIVERLRGKYPSFKNSLPNKKIRGLFKEA